MYMLKEKVTETLSRLLADSPNSSSSSPSPPLDLSQARPYSKGVKSMYSIFSYATPSAIFDGSKSNKDQDDIKEAQSLPYRLSSDNLKGKLESLDSFKYYTPICNNKATPFACEKDEVEDHASGRSSDSDMFEEATEPNSPEKPIPMPNLKDDSCFITSDLYEFLQSSLPNIVKGCQWVLMYSTLKHGISLHTLIRRSAELSGPCLLIVGDAQGAVFGGLLECPLKPTAKRKYQGTNQTFVFTTIYGEPRLFRPTGSNRYYYLCLSDLLALGGGGNFALCLDEDLLSGTSGPCETFGNLCLAHNPEFELRNVELWGFTHASQYLYTRQG